MSSVLKDFWARKRLIGMVHLGPLPGSDIFEPGDMEFYLAGRLESRRSYDYRSPVMTDMQRMLKYRHCERLYIIGPSGHADQPPSSFTPVGGR